MNGRDSEARTQIAAALAVGIRDAKMLRYAGEIALSAGDRAAAGTGHELFRLQEELAMRNAFFIAMGVSVLTGCLLAQDAVAAPNPATASQPGVVKDARAEKFVLSGHVE
jgi:hypothetical protein